MSSLARQSRRVCGDIINRADWWSPTKMKRGAITSLPICLKICRVISVGRLDISSEGLLLLTNDGELARHLELPATGWTRKYRVRVHGRVEEKKLKKLQRACRWRGAIWPCPRPA